MEVLGDAQFRAAAATVGGFDASVREFLRLPHGVPSANIAGLVKRYASSELLRAPGAPPLIAQIMTGEPGAAAVAARLLLDAGSPRVDLNCGCPSKRANCGKYGEGTAAGASLLREPERLKMVVEAMKGEGTVSVKMRTGFEDVALFDECVLAAVEGGAGMLAVHGRTRAQGYKGEADWKHVARAVRLCEGTGVVVVGNGDVESGDDVVRRVSETGCGGVMIGRGAVRNPWVFWEARIAYGEGGTRRDASGVRGFLRSYYAAGTGVDVFEGEREEVWGNVLEVVKTWEDKRHLVASGRLKMVVRYADWAKGDVWEMIRGMDGRNSLRFLEAVTREMEFALKNATSQVLVC